MCMRQRDDGRMIIDYSSYCISKSEKELISSLEILKEIWGI